MLKYFYSVNNGTISFKTPSYMVILVLAALLLLLASILGSRKCSKKFSTRQLAFCSICMALAFALSFAKLFEAPMGGSITPMSAFFITFVGYLYGTYAGVITGIAYGFLQLTVGTGLIHPVQILVDYPLAFGALGLSGLFANSKNGLIKGYLLGITGRLFFHVLSGVVFFASYAGDQNVFWYSFTYNIGYIGIEGILTIIILFVPAVKKGIGQINRIALDS
ncbi:energy-coupled thiamine transporter ThiT [[Clostridium] polysaccharolyticum]|jgi:thiamine transporter|uniref:Thiamine transporter n=1 Tax=[Clostridium] polysaccharolyticum TaxID=29364 RepID=A0A1H9YR55_9FIRM|nr:energy-coupled thiamine transporter ThiT [[Clostridium] polysaccharolyticum]SES71554.1 thiamine transporter [[Clostridium] polysaccharolyticum]